MPKVILKNVDPFEIEQTAFDFVSEHLKDVNDLEVFSTENLGTLSRTTYSIISNNDKCIGQVVADKYKDGSVQVLELEII